VRRLRAYFVHINAETRKCYDAGLSEADAVASLSLEAFKGWLDPERIVLNVSALYGEYSGGKHKTPPEDLYARLRAYGGGKRPPHGCHDPKCQDHPR
jgi:cyclase